jgi:MFS family permease
VDWAGAALAIVGVLSLMLALTWGGRQFGWLSAPIVGLLALAVVAGLAFTRVERRAKEPIVPPGLLRGPVVPFCCIGMFNMGLVWFGMILLGPLFLQDVLQLSATRSGGDLTPAVVLSGAASGLAGWLISRSGRCKPTLIAGAVTTLAGVAWLLTVDAGSCELSVDGALILIGLGIGWVIVPYILALQNAVPPSQQGVTMGVMSLFRQTGATLGTTMLGVFVSGSVAELAPEELSQAIHAGLWVLLGASLLLMLMALLVRDVPLRGKAVLQAAQPAG